ncbi:MAG: nucleotide exchange factor GrpE [Candidatus Nanoarchaeia archaeon]
MTAKHNDNKNHQKASEKGKDKKSTKTQNKECKETLSEVLAELEEKNDKLARLQAEFINFRNRNEQEKLTTYSNAVSDIFKPLINVFDDFELALQNSKEDSEFKKGIELIFAKLVSVAQDFDVEKIQTKDTLFDPSQHEALLREPRDDCKEGTIVEELQAGYKRKDKVIRTAKVKVATKN